MPSVNLLPPSVRFARKRNRRIRRWAGAVAVATVLAAIPVSINVVQTARAAKVQERIQPVVSRLESARKKMRRLRDACNRLQLQIERATALRTKRPWGDLLEALASTMPDEIWFTEIESYAAEIDPLESPETEQESDVTKLPGPTAVRIRGYALDYKWIYKWVDGLKELSIFKSIDIAETVSEPLYQSDAVRFTLECEW